MDKQKTLTILAGLFLLVAMSSAMAAVQISGGETKFVSTNISDPAYTVLGNSSNLNGLNVSHYNSTHIEVSLHKSYKPDNFTIHFISEDQITETKHHHHGGGGGGSGSGVIYKNNTVYENDTERIKYIPEGYVNASELDDEQPTPEQPEQKTDWLQILGWTLLGLFCGSAAGWIVKRYHQNKSEEKWPTQNTNESESN